MKKVFSIWALCLFLLMFITCIPFAYAENVTGNTTGSKTFYVHSYYSDSYIVLSSSTGVANVAQHNWLGLYQQNGNEKHHGFYEITMNGEGMNESFIWAPSATTNKSKINDCEEIKLIFPCTGDFTITIRPLNSSESMRYWKVDYIDYWVYDATWMTTIESGCSVFGSKTASSSTKKPTSQSTQIPNNYTGNGSSIIIPFSWDTQFKPSLSNGLNSDQYLNLSNLNDNNQSTTFWWVIWKNERTDSYPEITAYFNNASISSVGIRNGNPNNYYGYARAKRFRVEIYTNGSYAGSTYIYLNDQNSSSYQIMRAILSRGKITQISNLYTQRTFTPPPIHIPAQPYQ